MIDSKFSGINIIYYKYVPFNILFSCFSPVKAAMRCSALSIVVDISPTLFAAAANDATKLLCNMMSPGDPNAFDSVGLDKITKSDPSDPEPGDEVVGLDV